YFPIYFKVHHYVGAITEIMAALGIIAMMSVAPGETLTTYYPGLMLIMVFGYTVFRQRFTIAAICGWMIVALYFLTCYFFVEGSQEIVFNNNFYLLITNILGMAACYMLEYYMRRDFFNSLMLRENDEKLSILNKELEELVIERTQKLKDSNTLLEEKVKEIDYKNQILAISEKEFKAIFRNSPDGMAIFVVNDGIRKIIDCNNAYVHSSGISREELLSMADISSLQKKEEVGEDFIEVADSEEILNKSIEHGIYSWIRADGKPNLYSYKSIRISIFDSEHYYLIQNDIMEQKKFEMELKIQKEKLEEKVRQQMKSLEENLAEKERITQELQLSEKKFRLLAENARDIIFRYSLNEEKFIYVSNAAKEITGYSPEELYSSNRTVIKFIHPLWRKYYLMKSREASEGNLHQSYEYLIISKDGKEKWLNQRNTLIRDENGTPLYVEGIATDVTQSKREEEYLRKMKEKAESLNNAKSEFLANMSHEIRTPLHGILSFSKLALKKGNSLTPEKTTHYFQQIQISGNRLLKLLNDVLDLSKMESGLMKYEMKKNSLLQAVKAVEEEFSAIFRERDFDFSIQCELESTAAVFDYIKIIQVIRNLVSNAIKFSGDSKKIVISIDKSCIEIEGEQFDALELQVIDFGIGIPPNENDEIFEKFVQSSKTDSGAGGTGLGLSICKEIINRHYGSIRAFLNPEGSGSVFLFDIPVDFKKNAGKLYQKKTVQKNNE
ncbi:MAG: PAS domain S-box protein, partial [Candidatus Cloacimonetes bacterium]|nr:PAS domain S-box protein [Candidatus Cloacimonadota bacterium]